MGSWSYICKHCGNEAKEGEQVILANKYTTTEGVFDGYGGCIGVTLEGHDNACWHSRCYKKLSSQQQRDITPSKGAPEQGMGIAALEFLPGYPEGASPNHFEFHIECLGQEQRNAYYLTDYGLRDAENYDREKQQITETYWTELFKNKPNLSEVQLEHYEADLKVLIRKKIGDDPAKYSHVFHSLSEARDRAYKSIRELPDSGSKGYTIKVCASYKDLEGLVYEERYWNMPVLNKNGGYDLDVENFQRKVVYQYGRKATGRT